MKDLEGELHEYPALAAIGVYQYWYFHESIETGEENKKIANLRMQTELDECELGAAMQQFEEPSEPIKKTNQR